MLLFYRSSDQLWRWLFHQVEVMPLDVLGGYQRHWMMQICVLVGMLFERRVVFHFLLQGWTSWYSSQRHRICRSLDFEDSLWVGGCLGSMGMVVGSGVHFGIWYEGFDNCQLWVEGLPMVPYVKSEWVRGPLNSVVSLECVLGRLVGLYLRGSLE